MPNAKPSALIVAGHGLNCENETLAAFERAGGTGKIVHVDDLIAAPEQLSDHQILAVPGGFSYGDHTGAGKALANRLKAQLDAPIRAFLARDTLAIGICNGCQVLVKSELWSERPTEVSVAPNAGGSYICRWEPMQVTGVSPWLEGLDSFSLPIAHGEGRFVGIEPAMVGLSYSGENPNGSERAAAGLLGYDGRVLVMMPHPERAVRFTSQPDWTLQADRLRRSGQRLPNDGPGAALFANAIGYFA